MTTRLSAREMEVAYLVAEGLPDKMIASILLISENTVQTYLKRIAAKLEVKKTPRARRVAIARWVMEAESAA